MTKKQLDERLAEIWKSCSPKPWRKWDQYVAAMKATHGIADDGETSTEGGRPRWPLTSPI